MLLIVGDKKTSAHLKIDQWNIHWTAATSMLIIHWWVVASSCWPILVSMRIFYHWHKKVMDEKEYKGNFPPSNFKPMGMVECWSDHPTWVLLLMAPVKVWTLWPNAKIQICNSLTPAKPNLGWQQVITTKKVTTKDCHRKVVPCICISCCIIWCWFPTRD